MKNKLTLINKKLIEHFGIPRRNKKLPNPVDLLIATILSQNTNDKNSYKAFKNLKQEFKNWDEVGSAPRYQIEKVIKVAGLGKQKSTAIKNFLNKLISDRGKINLNHIKKLSNEAVITELTSYNGIGVKTASCVLLFSLDRNVCPVDTHVHRTLNRIGVVNTNSPEKTFFKINNNLPHGTAHQIHTNLIRLGRTICKPSNPNCSVCPLLLICEFSEKNIDSVKEIKNNDFMLLDLIK